MSSNGEGPVLDEPLFTQRDAVVIALRVAALVVLGFLASPYLAACAWIAVPTSLVELWAVRRRWRPSYELGAGVFLLAFFAFVAAYFQAIYTERVVATGSITVGMNTVERELRRLGDDMGIPLAVLVFGAECPAIAIAITTLWRCGGGAPRLLACWFGLILFVPVLDEFFLAVVVHDLVQLPDLSGLVRDCAFSAFLLGAVSVVATGGLLMLYVGIDHLAGMVGSGTDAERPSTRTMTRTRDEEKG